MNVLLTMEIIHEYRDHQLDTHAGLGRFESFTQEKVQRIVGSQLKSSLPATEFDNLGINIELHSRTIESFHSVAMNYS